MMHRTTDSAAEILLRSRARGHRLRAWPVSEGHFQGAGTWHHPWTDEELARLRELVADVTFWACDGRNEKPGSLRLDEDRLAEADEAWLPVTTPDGPGVLLWCNSD